MERPTTSPELTDDYRDLLAALVAAGARFIVVGAHALSIHGVPRATVDLDVWTEPTPENAHRVWRALAAFGAPLETLDIVESDFTRPDIVAQLGLPPNRIDILTGLSGLTFEEAWPGRVEAEIDGVRVPFLGRDALIKNKRRVKRGQSPRWVRRDGFASIDT